MFDILVQFLQLVLPGFQLNLSFEFKRSQPERENSIFKKFVVKLFPYFYYFYAQSCVFWLFRSSFLFFCHVFG